jgi:hypothetical protein
MATFRKRGPYQWQAQVRKKGQPLQTRTFETRAEAEQWARLIEVEMDKGVFVSRAEAESTPLRELLERYLSEVTPLKKGAAPETNRLRAFMRHPLAQRFVAGIRGVDIARFRDERLRNVSSASAKRDLVLLGHVFKVARKEWSIHPDRSRGPRTLEGLSVDALPHHLPGRLRCSGATAWPFAGGIIGFCLPLQLGGRSAFWNKPPRTGGIPATLPGDADALFDAGQIHIMVLINLAYIRRTLPANV